MTPHKTQMTDSESIAAFLQYLREVSAKYNLAVKDRQQAEEETQDILHRLELCEDNYHKTARLRELLREVRRKRREAKDMIDLTDPILACVP